MPLASAYPKVVSRSAVRARILRAGARSVPVCGLRVGGGRHARRRVLLRLRRLRDDFFVPEDANLEVVRAYQQLELPISVDIAKGHRAHVVACHRPAALAAVVIEALD